MNQNKINRTHSDTWNLVCLISSKVYDTAIHSFGFKILAAIIEELKNSNIPKRTELIKIPVDDFSQEMHLHSGMCFDLIVGHSLNLVHYQNYLKP